MRNLQALRDSAGPHKSTGAQGHLAAHKGGAGGFQGARGEARQPDGAEALRLAGKGAVELMRAVSANAGLHAADLAEVVADIRAGGATSLRTIAAAPNERGMLTRRGGPWQVSNVRNLIKRVHLVKSALPGASQAWHIKHGPKPRPITPNPLDPGNTWSDRGRKPHWYINAIAAWKSPVSLTVETTGS